MRRRLRGTTLVEMAIFAAIAAILLLAMAALFTRGHKLLEIGRRTSEGQVDLRIVIEHLSEDGSEIVYVEGGSGTFDSAGGAKLSFVVRSSRVESGLAAAPAGGALRRIEYQLTGSDTLKDCVRTVTGLGSSGGTSRSTLVQAGIKHLKVWTVAAVPSGRQFEFKLASDGGAQGKGATVACLVVDVAAGRAAGETALEKTPISQLVTKLWCRNRIMEMARGALN